MEFFSVSLMKLRWLLAAFVCTSGLSGCAYLGDSATPSQASKIHFDVRWQARFYEQWRANPYQATQITVAGDVIVVGDDRGQVAAYSAAGHELWRHVVEGGISAGAAIVGDRVYVGTDAGEVLALTLDKGSPVWRTALSSEVLTPVVPAGKRLVVQTNDGKLWALDAQSGAKEWSYASTMPTLSLRGVAKPLYDQEVVYAAFANGDLVALDAHDGHKLWQVAISSPRGRSELERLVDADATPVLAGEDVIAANYQGKLAAYKRPSGVPGWSREMSVYNALALADNKLYLVDAENMIYAIDPATGGTLWRDDSLKNRYLTAPAIINKTLLTGDEDGYLYAFDAEGGKRLGQQRIAMSGIQSAPVRIGQDILLLSREGTLYRVGIHY